MTNTTIKLKEKALKLLVENFKNNFKITEHTIYNIKEVQNVKIQNLNTNYKAKFTLCITRGKFGLFYCAYSCINYYSVGCRSPPNQSKPKNLD